MEYHGEIYKCYACNIKFEDDSELYSSWKCPHCGNRIYIEAPEWGFTLIRKLPKDLDIADFILLPGDTQGKKIIDIQPSSRGDDYTYVAIRGFGHIHAHNRTFQNILA